MNEESPEGIPRGRVQRPTSFKVFASSKFSKTNTKAGKPRLAHCFKVKETPGPGQHGLVHSSIGSSQDKIIMIEMK